MTLPQLVVRLRHKRSESYVAAATRLDAGTHVSDAVGLQSLIDAISQEFGDLDLEHRLVGIVSKCHLGEPYEVHICDLAGRIIEHFERHRAMPPLYERARALAAHGAYAFVEVYSDSLCAISADGRVARL